MKKPHNPINVDIAMGVLMLLALVLAYWVGAKKHAHTASQTREEISEDRALEAEVQELKLILANLKDQVNAVDERYSAATKMEPSSDDTNPVTLSHDLYGNVERLQQTRAFNAALAEDDDTKLSRANAQYYAETITDEWAANQEQAITEVLHEKEALQQVEMSALQCRTHSCRLVLNITEDAEPEAALSLVDEMWQELPYAHWQQQGRQLVLLLSEHDLTQMP